MSELKLYRVTLRGMTYSATGTVYGRNYVIAKDSNEAYKQVKDFLDLGGIGFGHEREMDKIELLATTESHNDTRCMLFIDKESGE